MKVTGELVLGEEIVPGDLFADTETGDVALCSEYGLDDQGRFDAVIVGSGEYFMWPEGWKQRRYLKVTRLIFDEPTETPF